MKKLTAFIAVVALGLLSSLTANAQINLSKKATLVDTQTFGDFQITHTATAADLKSWPPYGNKTFDLGAISIIWTPNTIPAVPAAFDYVISADIGALGSEVSYNLIKLHFTETNITGTGFTLNVTSTPIATVVTNGLTSFTLAHFTANYNVEFDQSYNVTTGGFTGLRVGVNLVPVPEPSTYALMGASGLAALVGFRRFRSKKANKA